MSKSVGIPKERFHGEKRIILVPKEVEKIVNAGHDVYVEKEAGKCIYIEDEDYENVGARVVSSPEDVFGQDVVVKLKAPTKEEFSMMYENTLFSMFHGEQNPDKVRMAKKRKVTVFQMEEVKNEYGERLIDQTYITGQQGMLYAISMHPKIPEDIKVLILGYGRVGTAAIETAGKLGAKVKVLRKKEYQDIRHFLEGVDILVNAISWPEYKRRTKEYVVTKDMLSLLNDGAIVLDLSVDFPNPIETAKPTYIDNPYYYVKDDKGRDIMHISIYGYPGLAPVSSSITYSEQVYPLLMEILKSENYDDLPEYLKRAMIRPDD